MVLYDREASGRKEFSVISWEGYSGKGTFYPSRKFSRLFKHLNLAQFEFRKWFFVTTYQACINSEIGVLLIRVWRLISLIFVRRRSFIRMQKPQPHHNFRLKRFHFFSVFFDLMIEPRQM
jgi:hypothetical protein